MESLGDVAQAVIVLCLLLVVAKGVRRVVPVFDRLYLPTSIIAGVLGLLLGPQVAGRWLGGPAHGGEGFIPAPVLEVWGQMPRLLISVVFAGLFIGKTLPGLRKLWRMGGPQALLGYVVSCGQYTVGLAVTLLVLTPLFGINPLAGVLLEISMSGGHGTAAGLAGTFAELDFAAGEDLALGLATVGLVAGVVLGTVFVNLAVRSPRIKIARQHRTDGTEHLELSALQSNEAPEAGDQGASSTDPLTLHLALIAIAIAIGWLLLKALVGIEARTYGPLTGPLMPYVPLFPVAMIGGAILQGVLMWTGLARHVSRELINRICGLSLDFIIVAAMATLSLASIGENWAPFTVLAITGVAWTAFCFWVLAPRMLPDHWFERGIGDFGQGTGMAVSGLLLMRIADPANRSGALESFGYKQLPFEPFLGGGLLTALALPLCARLGPVVLLAGFGAATLLATVTGILVFGPRRRAS